jgi:hypothetical protein
MGVGVVVGAVVVESSHGPLMILGNVVVLSDAAVVDVAPVFVVDVVVLAVVEVVALVELLVDLLVDVAPTMVVGVTPAPCGLASMVFVARPHAASTRQDDRTTNRRRRCTGAG